MYYKIQKYKRAEIQPLNDRIGIEPVLGTIRPILGNGKGMPYRKYGCDGWWTPVTFHPFLNNNQ